MFTSAVMYSLRTHTSGVANIMQFNRFPYITLLLEWGVLMTKTPPWPTQRPPLVGEVSANFCRYSAPHGQRDGSLWPYSRLSKLLHKSTVLCFTMKPQTRTNMLGICRDHLLNRQLTANNIMAPFKELTHTTHSSLSALWEVCKDRIIRTGLFSKIAEP
jgi:hypothetical protein